MSTPSESPPVVVRVATPDDAAIVRTLVGEFAGHQGEAEHVAGDVGAWRDMLGRPDVTVLLAAIDDRAVGYVSAVRRVHLWNAADVIALDDIYVRDGYRDRGIGLVLMNEVARRAAGLTITWSVQPDNQAAIRFYERLGATVRNKVTCAWPASRRDAS